MSQKRLLSIDALRGFDMMFIMGVAALISASCRLFPGGEESWLYLQMQHAAWDGFRQHDTIFPLFLFISGMTFPFSCAKRRENGLSEKSIFWNTLRRGLVLFMLGLVYNGIFRLQPDFRIPSVLGRIGLAWMFAAWLYMAVPLKGRICIAAALLAGYHALLLIPAPDAAGADSLSLKGNIVGWLDRTLMPDHLYKKGLFDPEGILSTLPAIVTAMLGQFTGTFIKDSKKSHKALRLMAAAGALLGAGLIWSHWLPVNKSLWTSSFVLVAGAWSVALAALFYWMIDVKGWTGWTPFFSVIGTNSITIYLAQKILPFKNVAEFFCGGLAGLLPEMWGKWLLALAYFAVSWLFLWFLYRKKVFIKV